MLWPEGSHTLQPDLRPGCPRSPRHPVVTFPPIFLSPFLPAFPCLSFLFVFFLKLPALALVQTRYSQSLFRSQPPSLTHLSPRSLPFSVRCFYLLSPSPFLPSPSTRISVSGSSLIPTSSSWGIPGSLIPLTRLDAEQSEPGQGAE